MTAGLQPRNDSDAPPALLRMGTPGAPREDDPSRPAEVLSSGRTPSPEQRTALCARHAQVRA